MERETHTINAEGKVLGRLAVEVALLLRGKNKPNFILNQDIGDFVNVENIRKMKITGKKLEQKKYYHHSGYLGNLKETLMKKLFEENPAEILRKAVYGMLPANKLRAGQLKRLKIN
jgi:large subunit ribosomal protein L13